MLAAALAILLELPILFQGRWNFKDKEFNRLWDICTLLFIGAGVFLRYSEETTNAAYKFFQWFPLVFYPMAFGFNYSDRQTIPISVFSWFLRRKNRPGADKSMAFGWIYFAACVVTAGASNIRDLWFFIGVVLLIGWAFWSIRPRRLKLVPWVSLFLLLSGAAFLTQSRLEEVQGFFEARLSDLFIRLGRRDYDPYESKTAMGRIGSLKQSSRIVLKIKADEGTVPERLRQTTFTQLDGNTWRGAGRSFESVPVEPDLTTWHLNTNTTGIRYVRIIERVAKSASLLSVPLGTAQLRDLNCGILETNRFALIRARENPVLLNFQALYGKDSIEMGPHTSPPRDYDLQVPEQEIDAISETARKIGAEQLSPSRKMLAIINYFNENFSYSTYQDAMKLGLKSTTPLANFLNETHAGHCEFFSSATVLLLRQYGIPARYTTGYSIQEDSRDGDYYVIRERDAHAWATAYINGHWVEVDSTPPDWHKVEEEEAPFYQKLNDQWETLTFAFLEWRWLGDRAFYKTIAPWLILPLAAFLAWRVFGRKMTRSNPRRHIIEIDQGADSEFFLIEKKLRRIGLERLPHETASQWLARIAVDKPELAAELKRLLPIHYQYRFDPNGISTTQRAELRTTAQRLEKIF
jgi:transglutaminase-like putative cysteine protease